METALEKTSAWPVVRLIAAWLLLGLLFDLRYPAPGAWWRPSLDATALLLVHALCTRWRRPPPAALWAALAGLVLVVRLFRFGDGITRRYFGHPFNLALDLPSAGELVRLLRSTLSPGALAGTLVVAVAGAAAVFLLAAWSLRAARRSFERREARLVFAVLAVVTLAGTLVRPSEASVVPRLASEVRGVLALPRRRHEAAQRVRAGDEALRRSAHGLAGLRGASVFVFLIESYGATVLERPEHARRIDPVYAAAERDLRQAGCAVVSGLLSSPTYAGRSWLAQATLATGVRTADHLTDGEVQRQRPTTMARLFREAGYDTILVQPGSTHRTLSRWLYDFDRVYSAWDFDYRGPGFRWAPMPDQYTIDFIHRNVVQPSSKPLLVEYALVSSHAPWSDQPPVVADWSRLGDGSIYRTLPVQHHPIGWTNLAEGAEAYLQSVSYDLQVLVRYVTDFVPAGALVIVLGDHQPVAEVTGWSPSDAVPIHVISRDHALVQAFRARGYAEGMRPRLGGPVAGMEAFLPALLADFSGR